MYLAQGFKDMEGKKSLWSLIYIPCEKESNSKSQSAAKFRAEFFCKVIQRCAGLYFYQIAKS